MCNTRCAIITVGVIICLILGYGLGVATMYGIAKDPGPYGTPIFDINGTLISHNFVTQVIPLSFLFFPIYSFALLFLCVIVPFAMCTDSTKKKDTETIATEPTATEPTATEPTVDETADDTEISLETKDSIDVDIESNTSTE